MGHTKSININPYVIRKGSVFSSVDESYTGPAPEQARAPLFCGFNQVVSGGLLKSRPRMILRRGRMDEGETDSSSIPMRRKVSVRV